MELFDLVKHVKEQTPVTAIELPYMEDLEDGYKELEKAEQAYFLFKKYLEQLHKLDSLSEGKLENDFLIEEDTTIYEDCTLNVISGLLRHVSMQLKKYKVLCEDIEAWIDGQIEWEAEAKDYGTMIDEQRFYWNNR